jgi:hypothetical protein
MLSNEKKIEIAKKMLRENKPFNVIAKKSHLSPNEISKLKKQMLGESTEFKHTQAYRMFDEGNDVPERKLILKVALKLGLTQEQIHRFFHEYLTMIRDDTLRELYTRNPEQIQALLDLEKALSDNNISQQEYLNTLPLVKNKGQLVYEIGGLRHQKEELQNDIVALIASADGMKSKEREAKMKISSMERQFNEKGESVERLNLVAKVLHNKNIQFKKLIEMAIKGEIEPLLKQVAWERRSYDKEVLLSFLEYIREPILDSLQYDPEMTCRLSNVGHWIGTTSLSS